jgi:hypothetical protein
VPDPRFNSCHLEPPRRARYGEARARLLGARGPMTQAAEGADLGGTALPPPLRRGGEPAGEGYALVDLADGRRYPLRVGLVTLGRFPENDIVLPEEYVSRRHCVVLVHATGGCEVHDTASLNGTLVNRERVSRARFEPGDVLRVCDRRFVLTCEGYWEWPAEASAGETAARSEPGSTD